MIKKLVLVSIALLVLAGVVFALVRREPGGETKQSSLIHEARLQGLRKKSASGLYLGRLKDGLAPPTNAWFSGLALQKEPKAVFPTPLSFLPKNASFEIGLPRPRSTDKTIFGSHAASMAAEIQGATAYKVVRYDELSVDLEYMAGDQAIGTVTIAAGSPYVFFRATKEANVTIRSEGTATVHGNEAKITSGKNIAVVLGFDGVKFSQQASSVAAVLPQGSYLTFYMLPKDSPDTLKETAGNRVSGSSVTFRGSGSVYETSIDLKTANGGPTAFGLLPHQDTAAGSKNILEYQTIYGSSRVMRGATFKFSTKTASVQLQLDVSKLSVDKKQLLVTTLRRDVNATQFDAEDTYFGGKSLYRAAQLLELAHQLEEPQIAASVQRRLAAELDIWFSGDNGRTKKYFYYDAQARGIVGEVAAFGSEEFNDHHFHYGYFIYAAAVLAKYDKNFVGQYGDMVNLLAADIANYNEGEQLPFRRSFDPYFGHSWASGSSPFGDGNNQESVSEAINAWVGVNLWAQQTKNTTLQQQAAWMLSNETAAAQAYWTDFDQKKPPYNTGYSKSIVALNWGGKRDYATFFSDKPAAMLGILLIPMNPTMVQRFTSANRIEQNVREAVPDGNYNMQFGDYLLMYKALSSSSGLLDKAQKLSDTSMDGANSRSYLYAWIMSREPEE